MQVRLFVMCCMPYFVCSRGRRADGGCPGVWSPEVFTLGGWACLCHGGVCEFVYHVGVCACVYHVCVCACVYHVSVCACVYHVSVCACVDHVRVCASVYHGSVRRSVNHGCVCVSQEHRCVGNSIEIESRRTRQSKSRGSMCKETERDTGAREDERLYSSVHT